MMSSPLTIAIPTLVVSDPKRNDDPLRPRPRDHSARGRASLESETLRTGRNYAYTNTDPKVAIPDMSCVDPHYPYSVVV
jgi:hypothetical protein